MSEPEWKYRTFTITGKVYSPNESVAKHRAYWSIADSEYQDHFLIESVEIENGEK